MDHKKLNAYIDSMQDEMIEDLKDLIRIDSQKGTAAPGMPFGEGPAKVLDAAGRLMEQKMHMQVRNYDNYVVTGDYGQGEKQLDILAHLDVVPVTDEWTVTGPFEPKVEGGRIYGRGSSDDKGPAIAVLYAVKAIYDLQIPLKHSLRVILGSDEECGSSDLEYYYAREEEAPFSFTPDADFPLINLEKGRLAKRFERHFEQQAEPCVVSLAGGDKVNIVPAAAGMMLRGLELQTVREKADAMQSRTGVLLHCEDAGDGKVLVKAKGLAAHGSTPEEGKNALSALITLAVELPLADGDGTRALQDLAGLFPWGDTSGKALGIAMSDEVSGALTLNLGVLKMDEQGVEGELDLRIPLCGTDENVTKVLAGKLSLCGFTVEEGNLSPVHYVPADSEFVQALLKSYETVFGEKGEPLYTGGGTYVHDLKRGVAFGCAIPGVDNRMHGDDEFMDLSVLVRSTKVFADAIIRICGEES